MQKISEIESLIAIKKIFMWVTAILKPLQKKRYCIPLDMVYPILLLIHYRFLIMGRVLMIILRLQSGYPIPVSVRARK